jgi:glycosyltransferase involved in cell wall biosynthesis
MPCYNETPVIEQVIRIYYNEIIAKIEDSEFIIIDDCSQDGTNIILERLKSIFPRLKVFNTLKNSGHGKALRMGYELATKEHIFQVDSDNQFEAQDFWRLYAFKDKYDYIVGFRKYRRDPLHRLILTSIIRITDFIIFGIWMKDINCPFRLIKKEVCDDILKAIDPEALAPNIMLSLLANKKKIKTLEIPVKHYLRAGTSSITKWKLIEFCFKGLGQLIVLRSKWRDSIFEKMGYRENLRN